ncbi:unnamed protein product [Nippostrongylus brasiliensis]|uniref:GON-4-like protein n=1 Tax=Nippostrongylus brasiliensis TaxID=27835 RepID=A0A0N4YHC5_NIPBR|nr:unnamed protein product [Nippostrongylus brasiliensis]
MERVLVELQHKLGHRLDTVLEDEIPEERSADEQDDADCPEEVKENGFDQTRLNHTTAPQTEDQIQNGDEWKKDATNDDEFLVISTQSI